MIKSGKTNRACVSIFDLTGDWVDCLAAFLACIHTAQLRFDLNSRAFG